MRAKLQPQETSSGSSEGGFVSRHDHRDAAHDLPSGAAGKVCLDEKLAHRALSDSRNRLAAPMSASVRDRLYDRMFPSHICLGTNGDDDPDPIP